MSFYAPSSESTTVVSNLLQEQPQTAHPDRGFHPRVRANRVEHLALFEAETTSSERYSWHSRCPERREFEGLATIVIALQEPARNNWGAVSLVLDDDLSVPPVSDTFISHRREAFLPTSVRWHFRYWVEHAVELAKECMSAVVEAPRKVIDPENEAEWWTAIPIGCRGEVLAIVGAYDKLTERFVAEVPSEARDRIRFELRIEN